MVLTNGWKSIQCNIFWSTLLFADLVENDEAAGVVAKTPIHTALAEANLFWCIILLSPAAQDTDTQGHQSHNSYNQHFNDPIW